MKRIFQRTIWSAMIITLGLSIALCGYNTYVYLYNQEIHKEAKQEEIARIEKFEEEAARMRALAEKSHEKCPSHIFLEARSASNGIEIPAYPHLSAIYVYIYPEALKMHEGSFIPLSEEELQKEIPSSYFKNNKRVFTTTIAKTISSVMPSLFIEGLKQSLAYCGTDEDGVPLKVNIVDKIQHANLEQKDALTIVMGVTLSPSNKSAYFSNKLYTSQYIPRWRVFPAAFKTDRGMYNISSNSPTFTINNFQAFHLYRLISLLTSKENAIKGWLANTWHKGVQKNQGFGYLKGLYISYKPNEIKKKYFINIPDRRRGPVHRGYARWVKLW